MRMSYSGEKWSCYPFCRVDISGRPWGFLFIWHGGPGRKVYDQGGRFAPRRIKWQIGFYWPWGTCRLGTITQRVSSRGQ